VSNWKVILATFAIFAAGVLAGGALAWKLAHSPESSRDLPFDPREMRRGYVSHLERELGLSEQQKTDISTVLSNSHDRVKLIFEDFNPRMRKEMEQVRDDIKALLDKDQRKKFEEMRMRRRGGPGPRGGPPDRNRDGGRDGGKYDGKSWRDGPPPGEAAPSPDRSADTSPAESNPDC